MSLSAKETKIRVQKAFNAMRAIGFSEQKIQPALKLLLKLHETNWQIIEKDKYRALADFLSGYKEAEVKEVSKNNVDSEEQTQATEDTPRPLKRLRHKYEDGQGSSAAEPNSSVPRVPKDEPCEIAESCGPPPLNASQTVVELHQLIAEINEGNQPSLDLSPLIDNAHLAITQISSAVVTMHHLMEQFDDQTKRPSDSEKELSASMKEALKAVAAAEERAKRAEEIARASMVAEKNALLALTKMEKEKFVVEEQLKQVRDVLDQAHKLAIGL